MRITWKKQFGYGGNRVGNKHPKYADITIYLLKKTSPDWDVVLVDKNNIYQYIPRDYSWLFQCQGPAFRADIIRSLLLFYHGGVYSDAACMNFKNLDETMNMVNFDDFFTLKLNHFRATTREAVSWFLIAPKGSKVFGKLAQTFVAAAKKKPNTARIFYVPFHLR